VEIVGVLDRDQFLDGLNLFRDFSGGTFKLTPGGALGDGVRLRNAVVSAGAQLRMYVDEWLDTGMNSQGVEEPDARDLTKAPNACAAVRRFAGEQLLRLEPASNGLRLRFPSVKSGPFSAPLVAGMDYADLLFSLFFLCEWRARLGKCRRDECGRYFELKHWNRAYKRGTLCPECQRGHSLASALRSTSEARKTAEKELYRLAARRFGKRLLKTADWHRGREFKATVVDFLNCQIMKTDRLKSVYQRGITGKWLSRSKNRNGIDEVARGEEHAKG
jgi:hypothetical protein